MAKDLYHQHVRTALENDGWTITQDPLFVPFGERKVSVDLGAEKLIIADKGVQKIAVEVKSFISSSRINDLHQATGQFLFYKKALKKAEPNRKLYLAMPIDAYEDLENDTFVREFIEEYAIQLLIFNVETKTLVEWKD